MHLAYVTPGVYQRDIVPAEVLALATGIAGFVGFAGNEPGVVRLDGIGDLAARIGLASETSFLVPAIRAFFENGGVRCHVSTVSAAATDREGALTGAVDRLDAIDDVDLIAVPDAMLLRLSGGGLDRDAVLRVQRHVLSHCARLGTRFAVLDAIPGIPSSAVLTQRSDMVVGLGEKVDGALYYPWIRNDAGQVVPPCGHLAGIYAATDATKGVARAPAGMALRDALDLEFAIDETTQGNLNSAGVNCLRAFPGRGIRVWGARTLSMSAEWRYINVRRLFMTLARWIDANMGWATFEPNTPSTWARIERMLATYLMGLWQTGALYGDSPAEAFFIKCDGETNSPDTREAGQLVVEIGLAPSNPAEFVVVRLALRPTEPA